MTPPVQPGQLALDLGVDRLPRAPRSRTLRHWAEHPELDLGPLVRRPRPRPGPRWPAFRAVREGTGRG